MYFKLRGNNLIPVCPSDLPVANPTADDYAKIDAYPFVDDTWIPDAQDGCKMVHDGYELQDGAWRNKWVSVARCESSEMELEQANCQEDIKNVQVGDISEMSFNAKDALLKKVILAVQPIV